MSLTSLRAVPQSDVRRSQDQRALRSQGVPEPVDHPVCGLAVEVDEHVPADDQVERRLAERRHAARDEVVLSEGDDAPEPVADDELLTVLAEVLVAQARRDGAQRALAIPPGA